MKNIIYILYVIIGSQITINAQDVHFSQFETAPFLFNPSLTGVFESQKRVAVFYRNQWHTALRSMSYETYALSYEQKLSIGRKDFLGLGGFIQRDKAGDIELGKIDLQLSGAYIRKIGGGFNDGHFISAGFALGASHLSVNPQKLNWGDEYNIETNDFSGANGGEVLLRNNKFTPNIAAGVTWWSVINKKTRFYLGVGLDHLNQPNISLLGNSMNRIPLKLSINGGSEFSLNNRISLLPSLMIFKQTTFKE